MSTLSIALSVIAVAAVSIAWNTHKMREDIAMLRAIAWKEHFGEAENR
ncbi:hypothetical protein ABIF66_008789 [Bradyrhizobium japonicum]